jgi:hypothetical protein
MAESLCDNPSKPDDCETVGKVFYRASPLVDLLATALRYVGDQLLQADGSIWLYHDPVQVNFTWSIRRTRRFSNPAPWETGMELDPHVRQPRTGYVQYCEELAGL